MKTNTLEFDAQALREKILDLAMRGKLVPQDPDDEPASVLLEKIKAEKEQLIKEKKIKRTKKLDPITDDEKPFDIPDSWEWVRLGKIIKPEIHKKPEKDYIYLDIASVDNTTNKVVNPKNIDISKDKIASRARQVLENNDILFSVVRPYLKNIAMVPNTKEYQVGSTGFYVIKPFSQINRKFVFYLVLSNYVISGMTRKMKGDNSPSIRKGDLEQYLVPLPPLEEQSRIAAKIAQLFALLRKVESSTQQYAKLQTLLKSKVLDLAMRGKLVKQDPHDEPASVLLEKIKVEKKQLIKEKKIKKSKPLPPISDEEKPFEIPDSWEWVRLGEVIELISGRDIPKKFHLATQEKDSVPYITGASNINDNGKIHISEWVNKPSVIVNKGVILLSVKGTIGKLAELDIKRAHIARQIMGINNIFNLNKNYEKLFIESYIQELKNKAKSMIPGISREDLLLISFPVPPLEEQGRIVAKVGRLYDLFYKDAEN